MKSSIKPSTRKQKQVVSDTSDGSASDGEEVKSSPDIGETTNNSETRDDRDVITEADERLELFLKRKLAELNRKRKRVEAARIVAEEICVTPLNCDNRSIRSERTPHSLLIEERALGEFDGSGDLETFLQRLDDCSRRFHWNDDDKTFILRGAVKGMAAVALTTNGTNLSGDKIITQLQQHFGRVHRIARFRTELENRRRKPEECLADLYLDLCRLRNSAYPDPEDSRSETYFVMLFAKSVDDEQFERDILKNTPTTMEQAYTNAVKLEAFGLYKHTPSTVIQSRRRINITERENSDRPEKRGETTTTVSSEAVAPQPEATHSILEKKIEQLQAELSAFIKAQTSTTLPVEAVQTAKSRPEKSSGRPNFESKKKNSQKKDVLPVAAAGKPLRPCWTCGLQHWNRDCPHTKAKEVEPIPDPVNLQATGEIIISRSATARNFQATDGPEDSKREEAYIDIFFRNTKQTALLDSGAEVSVIGRSWIPNDVLSPTTLKLRTADGTTMPLMGETRVRFFVGELELEARVAVTTAVTELILGIDWMTHNNCMWDFGKSRFVVQDCTVSLRDKRRHEGRVRKLVVRSDITIPAFHHVNVPIIFTRDSLCNSATNWASQNNVLKDNVVVASTVLNGTDIETVCGVMNLSDVDRVFKAGTFLVEADPVEPLGETEQPTP